MIESVRLFPKDLDEILGDVNLTLRLAVGAAAGASNLITRVAVSEPDRRLAALLQKQSEVWLQIHSAQLMMESRSDIKQAFKGMEQSDLPGSPMIPWTQ